MTCAPPTPFESLDDLQRRLLETDLIPSQEPLLDRLSERFGLLSGIGIASISDLQARLKNRRTVEELAGESGVDADYLMLLRRAVGGFLPKPNPLRSFDWVDPEVIDALGGVGVKNSQQLWTATGDGVGGLAEETGIPEDELSGLATVAGLVRVQWVSPSFARALIAAGFSQTTAIAAADPDELGRALATANQEGTFYSGTIGQRDIKRLIHAAAYVP